MHEPPFHVLVHKTGAGGGVEVGAQAQGVDQPARTKHRNLDIQVRPLVKRGRALEFEGVSGALANAAVAGLRQAGRPVAQLDSAQGLSELLGAGVEFGRPAFKVRLLLFEVGLVHAVYGVDLGCHQFSV